MNVMNIEDRLSARWANAEMAAIELRWSCTQREHCDEPSASETMDWKRAS